MNELRFEDENGKQEVFIHAQKDQNNIVRKDETTQVGSNRSESVGNNEILKVGQHRQETIGGYQVTHVGNDILIQSLTGDITLGTAAGNITLTQSGEVFINGKSVNVVGTEAIHLNPPGGAGKAGKVEAQPIDDSLFDRVVGGTKGLFNEFMKKNAAMLADDIGATVVDKTTGETVDLAKDGKDVLPPTNPGQEKGSEAVKNFKGTDAIVMGAAAITSKGKSVVRDPKDVADSVKKAVKKSDQNVLTKPLRNKLKRIENQVAAGGNRGVTGSVTRDDALKLGEKFVGPGYKPMSNGKGYVSADGLRSFRFPSIKKGINPATGESWSKTGQQVNFETKLARGEQPVSNVHLDVK